MFLENKYTKWYFQLIESTKTRKADIEYFEKHHIMPKCLGGSNASENLVRFTAREHFIAHLLLTKMLNGPSKRKMIFALFRMTSGNNKQQRYNLNNRSYELIKQKMREEIREQNKNQIYTDEQLKKFYKTLEESGGPWNKGKKMSDDFKKKCLTSKNKNTSPEERRKKISEAVKRKRQLIRDGIIPGKLGGPKKKNKLNVGGG